MTNLKALSRADAVRLVMLYRIALGKDVGSFEFDGEQITVQEAYRRIQQIDEGHNLDLGIDTVPLPPTEKFSL